MLMCVFMFSCKLIFLVYLLVCFVINGLLCISVAFDSESTYSVASRARHDLNLEVPHINFFTRYTISCIYGYVQVGMHKHVFYFIEFDSESRYSAASAARQDLNLEVPNLKNI